jgi:hypothetical protein
LRYSIPALLSFAIAAVGVAGVVLVASATTVGTAPGNGQKVFDAPGCLPRSYAGPGGHGHYLLNRNCPTPHPVILRSVARLDEGWVVRWDGSRSFDPIGGGLVDYAWDVDGQRGRAPQRHGARISVHYDRPGPHSIVLYVTDDSGLTGAADESVRLP